MTKVLVLNSSVSGEASASRALVQSLVERLSRPGVAVIERDLGADPIPHLTPETMPTIRGADPVTPVQHEARALADGLIAELKDSDVLVIGAPMYNFAIPTGLKAWFDHVLRAGATFRYSEAGPEGLVTGKKAIVVLSRGGLYSEGPAAAVDFQEPHLRQLLAFMGITDVTFVRAEKLGFGPEAREQALADARDELGRLANADLPKAA
ncbi:FMN-dependent NADH-azoreductase [Caulobacter sp. SLTY]|uniref:FMN-dependent NADH-azoreductase n=1 Tax=Caulobacter sp. SLTY TaxID=2683262 RepID=UPI001412A98F|nr:FMN-dependent NADH-azoreductase [Caulobacter sp. SLTY]NBB17001.1 FMN-dependent NADH-azoreductase [Caulobacter sp. SLTY]